MTQVSVWAVVTAEADAISAVSALTNELSALTVKEEVAASTSNQSEAQSSKVNEAARVLGEELNPGLSMVTLCAHPPLRLSSLLSSQGHGARVLVGAGHR